MGDLLYPSAENLQRMAGVIQGTRKTSVTKSAERTSAGTTTLFTVTTDKTLFITSMSMTYLGNTAGRKGAITIDTADADNVTVMKVTTANLSQSKMLSIPFFYPLQVPSEKTVKLVATEAVVFLFGFFHGWEETLIS